LIGFCAQGVAQPRAHTGFHRPFRHFAAVAVEQREFSTGLRQSALKISALRLGRPHASRNMAGEIGCCACGSALVVTARHRATHG
jgi:hypothetical protein